MAATDARAQNAVPCGLLERGVVTQPIRKGELLTYGNTAPEESLLLEFRRRQDKLVHGVALA
jgi:predicted homoserine dehydrogenase-like protein